MRGGKKSHGASLPLNATIQGGGSPLVRPVAYNCDLRAQCRMLSTFKRHKQSRKSPKQLQNKQNMWRNKLEKVPRKGPEGKYGKSKAEKRSYYQNFSAKKRQRSQQNRSVLPIDLIQTLGTAIIVPRKTQ